MGASSNARVASDLIARLSGKAYWRKLFVRSDLVPVGQARGICAEIIAGSDQRACSEALGARHVTATELGLTSWGNFLRNCSSLGMSLYTMYG